MLALGARDSARATHWVGILLAATIVVMLLIRDDLRRLTLRNAGLDTAATVVSQWGPFAVFVACLAAAVVVIAWMVKAVAQGRPESAE